jgi:hypothetical protein
MAIDATSRICSWADGFCSTRFTHLVLCYFLYTLYGGGLEYLHRSLATRKRRQKGNPAPGDITGPPCSWGIEIRWPGPPGWGSLRWDIKLWPWVLREFDLRVTVLESPKSNCTVNYRPVLSSERALQNNKAATVWRKFQGERKIGHGSQMGAWHQDRLADWLSVVN